MNHDVKESIKYANRHTYRNFNQKFELINF